jgi:glycerol uptake facilitator-like aquaporin
MLGTGLGLIMLALFSGASSARRAARINPASSLSVE